MKIVIPQTTDTDPESLVEYAIKLIHPATGQYDINFAEGDKVWVVFDCDNNNNDDIRDAVNKANRKGIDVAFSNPQFELWYLLHGQVVNQNQCMDKKQLMDKVNRFLQNYDKAKCVYSKIEPAQSAAITRAEDLEQSHLQNGVTSLYGRESNPFTNVHKLVKYILDNYK